MPHQRPVSLFAFALFLSVSANLMADNWTSWRGPTSNGISTETNLPTEWSKDQNVAWRTPLPGPAGATPVVWGNQIFLTSLEGENLLLMCFGTDGKEQWRQVVGTGNKDARGDEGNSASPSPITDGKHVWSMMGTGDVACYTLDGTAVWKLNLQERFGKFDIAFGMSATPVLHENRLFIQLIHGDGKASTQEAIVVCLNGEDGSTIWKKERVTGAENENEHSYASPMLYNFGNTAYLITHGADFTIAYALEDVKNSGDLADSTPTTILLASTIQHFDS